eukprot:scaffold2.g7079.t1
MQRQQEQQTEAAALSAEAVVAVLLRELSAAKRGRSEAEAQLGALKEEYLEALRRGSSQQQARPPVTGPPTRSKEGPLDASRGIPAFRPAGATLPTPVAARQAGAPRRASSDGDARASLRRKDQRQQQQQQGMLGGTELASRLRAVEEQCRALAGSEPSGGGAVGAVQARRWQETVDAQAGSIAELRVDVEQERRRQQQLVTQLACGRQAVEEQEEDAAAALRRLATAEAAAAAAEGEAAALRRRLREVQDEAEQTRAEVGALHDELNALVARLQASELVRREAEADRDGALADREQLLAALAEARAEAEGCAQQAERQAAAARQELAVERQRGAMLEAQLRQAEGAAAETERLLRDQLRVVQAERTACLAAATRADALLVRLGAHALQVKGEDGE